MKEDLRYERKYYISGVPSAEVVKAIKINSGNFSEIHHIRQINNIYFDTPGYESYYDNVDGSYNRLKARIRWYGDTFGIANKPVLELKIKKGLLGYKRNFSLPNFLVDSNLTKKTLVETILTAVPDESVKQYLKSMNPALMNVYTRQYFITADKKIRLTMDTGMHFYKISNMKNLFLNTIKDNTGIVVEMKYDVENENIVNLVSSEFPFLMTKNSKYLQGLSRIGLLDQ